MYLYYRLFHLFIKKNIGFIFFFCSPLKMFNIVHTRFNIFFIAFIYCDKILVEVVVYLLL